MRSQKISLTVNPVAYTYKNTGNRFLEIYNLDPAATIYLQYGPAPGTIDDAWPIGPGQVKTQDPAAPYDTIWLWASVANINNRVTMG
jgi:hypothetical protein